MIPEDRAEEITAAPPQRAIWVRYWLVVTWLSACVGATAGASVAILTKASTGTDAITAGAAALLVLCLGVYSTAGMRRAIKERR